MSIIKGLKIIPAVREKKSQKKIFAEIREERQNDDGSWTCADCGNPLWELKAHNFSHEEGKGRCPKKKYDKDNIVLRHYKCHVKHDSGKEPENADWLDY